MKNLVSHITRITGALARGDIGLRARGRKPVITRILQILEKNVPMLKITCARRSMSATVEAGEEVVEEVVKEAVKEAVEMAGCRISAGGDRAADPH